MKPSEENLRRAAILVLSLDDATAETVLEQLPQEDAARVRRIMVDLQTVDSGEERQIIREFLRRRPAATDRGRGVELLLGSASRAAAAGPMLPAASTSDANKPFRFLHATRGDKITSFISGEHPQTIAVVVSHLPDDRAAAVLATLEGDLQAQVIQRLIDLDQADPELVREVEAGLESRMQEQAQADRREESGLESVVRILDAAEPGLRRAIMVNLSRRDRPLAERLRPQQFEFNDLRHVDDATLTTILAAAGVEVARLALAGADDELVDRLVKPLSPAEAKKMRRMIERLGPVRLSDVEEAQSEVARVACQLALEGAIELPSGTRRLVLA
jgi:flagellar motor switch protein FliG